jgi:hypothetical protein
VDGIERYRVAETLGSLSDAQVVVIALLGIGLAVSRRTWRLAGYPVTIVHELGHALAALSVGYRLRGITVNGDMSGATNFWARGTFGSLWTMWWGYPAPAAAGAALIWSAGSGWARVALGVLVVALGLVFLLSRSWHTVAAVLVTGVGLGLVAWYAPGVVTTVVVFALGWLLIVGAVRGLWSVVRAHGSRRGIGSSDAYLMSRRLRAVPGVFWLLTFTVAIGAAAWYAGTSVVDVVAPPGELGSG